MTYRQACNYLNSFINYERLKHYPYRSSFKLRRMQRLLELLGRPHRDLRIIHIAGTKGKGSTCAFTANILSAAGFKVGLYTSPHLVEVRERFRLLPPNSHNAKTGNWMLISRRDFAGLMQEIRPHAERLRQTPLGRLSFFEILTGLAFLYFRNKDCDFVVLETGLGGRLDATNAASALVCGLTPISYEHTQVLGQTLARIAAEKAGIIKCKSKKGNGQIVVTAPQRPAVLKVIRRRVRRCAARLFEVGKDIRIKEGDRYYLGHWFDVTGVFGRYRGLKLGLLGRHQMVNAAVAIGCVESLRCCGIKISPEEIRRGIRQTRWAGRLQLISRRPQIVLDGAHNQASGWALRAALNNFRYRHLILVFGVSHDKDVKGLLKELAPAAAKIVLTKSQNPRALEPEIIRTFLKPGQPVILTQDSAEAMKAARKSAGQRDLILVCGSLFLVGEVLKAINRQKKQGMNEQSGRPIL